MKKNSTMYLIGLLLVVALIASVALVMRNQEMRKGAYFAGGKLFLQVAKEEWLVGDDIPVHLWVETGVETKVDNVAVQICYDAAKLGFETAGLNVENRISINNAAGFNSIPYVGIAENGVLGECLDLTVSSDKAKEELLSGTFEAAVINFKASGTGAQEHIEIIKNKSKLSGHNSDSIDKAIEIELVAGVVVSIVTEEIMPTVVPTVSLSPTEPVSTIVPTMVPTSVPPEGEGLVLQFKMAFKGLRNAQAVCGQNWPVDLIVMGDGETVVYTGLPLSVTGEKTEIKADGSGGEAIFATGLRLGEFNHDDNLAIFLRGPMHLQVKYGKDGQTEFYSQPGGEISLSDDFATSKLYDFSNYPVLAGDVTGEVDGVSDGRVDGRDFSYIKSRVTIDKTLLSDGAMVNGDFDGDCWIGNIDLAILMLSLKEKYDQLY